MEKTFLASLCLIVTSTAAHPEELPDSINYYTSQSVEVAFIGQHDPGYVELKPLTGGMIDATYAGIEFETLWAWENEQESAGSKRIMYLTYTNEEGVVVRDKKSGVSFRLVGEIQEHPIDIAVSKCKTEYSTTRGIGHCKQLALEAWDAELNRSYKELGGGENVELRKAQRTWMKYRDAQIDYLSTEYGKRDGTIWGLVYMDHVISITKNQANLLKRIKEW